MTIKNSFMAQQINPDQIADLMRAVAAQYIVPRFRQLSQDDISSKTSPNDLVTIADKEAELAMEAHLRALYPECLIVGEEGVSEGRSTTADLANRDRVVWVVDPVDGTYNFVHGKPEFGMLLACIIDGEVTHGWLYDIPGNRMMIAQKGKGVAINGVPVAMRAPQTSLPDMTGHAGLKYFPPAMRDDIKNFRGRVKSLHTLSCACHEYFRVVAADTDFAIYSKMRPWDHLAGALAVQEAGGYAAKWDGSLYRASDEFGGLVVAKSRDVWQSVQAGVIRKMIDNYRREP